MEKNKKVIFLAAGIFISYFYFGILQEKVTKQKYEYEIENKNGVNTTVTEKFEYTLSLVFAQCLVNYIVAEIALKLWPQEKDTTPRVLHGCVALTYLLGMIGSNMALQWIPFPTQVVGKSAKPIPVMILGVLLGKKSYAIRKYIFVLMIVFGCVLFMLKDKAPTKAQETSFGIGEILLIFSLTMDGLTGAVQERIRALSKPTGHQMMRATNFCACAYLLVALFLTKECFAFAEFTSRHPSVIPAIVILALTQSVGQLFLYSMVADFGPLLVSIVTTTRKFFTVLASVVLFGNVLTNRQWMGAVFVFTALFLDAFYSKGSSKKPETTK